MLLEIESTAADGTPAAGGISGLAAKGRRSWRSGQRPFSVNFSKALLADRQRSFSGPRLRRGLRSAATVAPFRDEVEEGSTGHVDPLATSVGLQATAAGGANRVATPTKPGSGFVEAVESIGGDCPRNGRPCCGGPCPPFRTFHHWFPSGRLAVRSWMAVPIDPRGAQVSGVCCGGPPPV